MTEYTLHPQGRFDATIKDHGFAKAKNGTLQIFVDYETSSGHVRGYFALTNAAGEYTMQKLRKMGYMRDDLDALADGRCMAENKCNIVVEHDTYNGKTSAKVKFVNAFGERQKNKLDKTELRKTNLERFNILLKNTPKEKQEETCIDGYGVDLENSEDYPF